MTEKIQPYEATPLASGREVGEGEQLQVFVEMMEFYGIPYVAVMIAHDATEASELFGRIAKTGFRSSENGGSYEPFEQGKLFILSLQQAGVYLFQPPSDPNLR